MAGRLLQKITSDSSETFPSRRIQLVLIFSAGILAVCLHETLRWPLHLPGRHGLELMALLMFVRLSAPQRDAATLAALGGVSATLLFNDAAGVGSLILLAQGWFIDKGYHLLKHHSLTLWLMIVITALAHSLKPLIKLGFQSGLGIASDSLAQGLTYPLITHFSFGLVGGLAGILAWRSLLKVKSEQT